MDGTQRHLVGELRDKALYGVPLYGQCYAGIEGDPVFRMPEKGEFRLTYFLKSPSPLLLRLRLNRADKTLPYDYRIAQPTVGQPTELRVPFSQFQYPYGAAEPVAAGDVVRMVYVAGEDPNCGLRIDALSMVELPSAPASTPSK
jgi:hypothetical protein